MIMFHGPKGGFNTAKQVIASGFRPSGKDDYSFGDGVYMTPSFSHALAYSDTVMQLYVYRAPACCSSSGETYSCHQPSLIFPISVFTDIVEKDEDGGEITDALKRQGRFNFD